MSPTIRDPTTSTERPVTDAELSVLRILWRHGASTVRALAESLYPGGGASAHATVQKLLERLASKGCVERHREGRAYVFRAIVSRRDLIGRRLQDIADTFFGGALTPLLSHLVAESDLDDDDLSQLRGLVDSLDDEGVATGGDDSGKTMGGDS